jgi:hypothetical protein
MKVNIHHTHHITVDITTLPHLDMTMDTAKCLRLVNVNEWVHLMNTQAKIEKQQIIS